MGKYVIKKKNKEKFKNNLMQKQPLDLREFEINVIKMVRSAEMKAQMLVSGLKKEIDEIKTNQIVLQTILHEQNILEHDKFKKEFEKYIRETIGIVNEGQMEGNMIIEMYNINVNMIRREFETNKIPQIIED